MAGRRWGFDSVWLHRDEDNKAAEQLYARLGYERQQPKAGLKRALDRRVLLRKPLQPWRINTQPDFEMSGQQGPNRVFVWQQRSSETS